MQLSWDHFEANEYATLGSCRFTGPANPFQAQGLGSVAAIWGIWDDFQANCAATDRDHSIDTAPNEDADSDVDAWTLTQDYDFGWGEITSITAYREIENFNGTWGWVMGNGPGANFLEVLDNASENEILSQELRLAGNTERLEWIVGAYWFEENSDERVDAPLFRGVTAPAPAEWPLFHAPNPLGMPPTLGGIAIATQTFGSRSQAYDVTNKNRAVFAEGTWAVTDKLDLTLGARYIEDEREFTRIQTLFGGAFDPGYFCPGMPTVEVAPGVIIPASDRCTQEVEYDETTPRFIASYQISGAIMLYGSYSKGYSSGGFNQDARMRPFLPEESDNIELGVKSVLLDSKLRLNATVFHNSYENQQLTVARILEGQPTADLINAQEATIQGLEVELLAQLTERLVMTVTAGYIDGEYDKFTVEDNLTDPITLEEFVQVRDLSDTGFGTRDGKSTSLDIGFLHTVELGNGGEITTSIGASFTDDRYYTLGNTPSSFVPDYWIADARMTWHLANGKTSISLWGTNITDEDYVDTMLNQSGDVEIGGNQPSLGMSADYWGEPRRLGVEVRHEF